MATHNRVSRPLVLTALGCLAVGLALGVVTYATRSDVREHHTPGTEAWPQHGVVAVLALLVVVFAARRRRLTLLAPVSAYAAARLSRTLRTPRALLAVPLVALLAYSAARAGMQVTGGLDPNFTANAWGGPGYLGAMACHYLDGALIAAAAAGLLDRVLLPVAVDRRAVSAPRYAPSGLSTPPSSWRRSSKR